jgi:hypothetical protein
MCPIYNDLRYWRGFEAEQNPQTRIVKKIRYRFGGLFCGSSRGTTKLVSGYLIPDIRDLLKML